MGDWFRENILDTGRLPLFCFFAAFVLTFAFIRFSVRMIRAEVSWWPGNITPGGLHIHHVVFGTVAMVAGGVAGLAVPVEPVVWRAICASFFGIGTALVLDEFALILHLDDVYWAEEGRLSVDAVAIATGISGLLLLGGVPLLNDLTPFEGEGALAFGLTIAAVIAIDLALAAITLLKGKLWTGLLGLFIPLLLIIGAIRLARPASVWSRKRYQARDGRPGRPAKLARAQRREQRYREPVHRLKVTLQDAVAGAPSRPVETAPSPVPEAASSPVPEAASGPVPEVAENQHRPG